MSKKYTSENVRKWLGYLAKSEIAELKRISNELEENPVVVNIGAGGGTSGLSFMESRDDITLYTIDIQEKNSPLGCLEGEEIVMKAAGFDHLADERWFQILSDSKLAGLAWDNGPVDFVFIDGDHSYAGAAGDITNWLPHIKPGGYMAVHDYDKEGKHERTDRNRSFEYAPHPTAFTGTVDVAVDELLRPHYKIESIISTTITFRINYE